MWAWERRTHSRMENFVQNQIHVKAYLVLHRLENSTILSNFAKARYCLQYEIRLYESATCLSLRTYSEKPESWSIRREEGGASIPTQPSSCTWYSVHTVHKPAHRYESVQGWHVGRLHIPCSLQFAVSIPELHHWRAYNSHLRTSSAGPRSALHKSRPGFSRFPQVLHCNPSSRSLLVDHPARPSTNLVWIHATCAVVGSTCIHIASAQSTMLPSKVLQVTSAPSTALRAIFVTSSASTLGARLAGAMGTRGLARSLDRLTCLADGVEGPVRRYLGSNDHFSLAGVLK